MSSLILACVFFALAGILIPISVRWIAERPLSKIISFLIALIVFLVQVFVGGFLVSEGKTYPGSLFSILVAWIGYSILRRNPGTADHESKNGWKGIYTILVIIGILLGLFLLAPLFMY